MNKSTIVVVFLLLAGIGVASYYVRLHVSEKKKLWAEQVMTVSKSGTIDRAVEVLGNPNGEWKALPTHLLRYSNRSVTNFSRVLMFTRLNQGAFMYVDDNDNIIGAEVFEQ